MFKEIFNKIFKRNETKVEEIEAKRREVEITAHMMYIYELTEARCNAALDAANDNDMERVIKWLNWMKDDCKEHLEKYEEYLSRLN